MRDGIEHAERHDAAAGRRIGGDEEAVEGAVGIGEPRAKQRGAQISGGADLQRDLRFLDHPLEILVGHGGRPAIDVERDVRMHLEQMVAGDGAGAGDRGAAGVAGGDQSRRLGVGDQRHVVV